MSEYSVSKISKTLVAEIKKALKSVHSYGSVEIYVSNGEVSQITVRNIKKTSNGLSGEKPTQIVK